MKEAAKVIESCKNEIMDEWEEEVKEEIAASRITPSLVLRNILPKLLDNIMQILGRHQNHDMVLKNEKYEEVISNSIDHGRHRATSPDYTIRQIVREYIVLNRILASTLISRNSYDADTGITIMYILGVSQAHSLSAFSDAIQEMREKLIGTLAHDMRNPISAAHFSINIMKYEEGEERFNRMKKLSLRSLGKSIDLIDGLLDAITIRAGEGITLNFSETDVIDEVKWVYGDAREIYSNEIRLECNSDEIKGVFDGTAIRRVLENLVTNAVKYGSRGKPITISVLDHPEKITLQVHNHGNIIPPENQERIFDFLTRADQDLTARPESWGMGLALVKIVAEAHEGHVELESDREKGTTFSVILNRDSRRPGKVRSRLKPMKES